MTIHPTVSLEEVTHESSPAVLAAAHDLLLEYGRWVIAQPGAGRFCFGSLEMEATGLPASYRDQGGGWMIALADGDPAGFIAWRALPDSVAANAWELKRLWVRPEGRGLGLGKALTLAVLDRARAARRSAVYLDTAPASMGSAYRLYRELGFVPCKQYNDNPVEGLAYLSLQL